MASMSYVLSLEKENFPGITKVRRIPDIEELNSKKFGNVYMVYYFFFKGNEKPRMVGIASKDKSFKTISHVTLFNLRLQPAMILETKPEVDKDEFINGLGKFISTAKYEIPVYKESLTPMQTFLGIAAIATAYYIIKSWVLNAIKGFKEYYVSRKLEDDNNKLLFQGQKGEEPAFAMFGNMVKYIQLVIQKRAMAVIICGRPGMSKTYTVRRTLHFSGLKPGKDYVIEKGSTLGLPSTYDMLYRNRDRILVLDDFDKPLKDPEIVNLLKGITDTYAKRIISLPRTVQLTIGASGTYSPIPEKFEFRGRVIIITNLLKTQIDSALISRAPTIEVNFDTKKVMEGINQMIKYTHPGVDEQLKWEVYHYLEKLYKNDPRIDITFRSFVNAVNARIGSPNEWKEITHLIVNYKGKKIVEQYLTSLF